MKLLSLETRSKDNTHKGQTHSWRNQNGSNIIQASQTFSPRHTLGMLRWMVKEEEADQRDSLGDKS